MPAAAGNFVFLNSTCFIDAIGAVYDWNALFGGFPGSVSTNVYRVVWLMAAALWFAAEKKEIHTAQ